MLSRLAIKPAAPFRVLTPSFFTTRTNTRFFSATSSSKMVVKEGDAIPSIELMEGSPGDKVDLAQLLKSGKGIILGVPAAFSESFLLFCLSIWECGWAKVERSGGWLRWEFGLGSECERHASKGKLACEAATGMELRVLRGVEMGIWDAGRIVLMGMSWVCRGWLAGWWSA